jgi:hypothetical protein
MPFFVSFAIFPCIKIFLLGFWVFFCIQITTNNQSVSTMSNVLSHILPTRDFFTGLIKGQGENQNQSADSK